MLFRSGDTLSGLEGKRYFVLAEHIEKNYPSKQRLTVLDLGDGWATMVGTANLLKGGVVRKEKLDAT